MTYQFFSCSQAHPSKQANGDHTRHMHLTGTDNKLALAVADGVSSHDYDWQASKTTCDACMANLAQTSGDLGQRLQQAIETANDDVQSLRGPAQGALSTLLLAVYEPSSGKCQFTSIGDSRVYKVGGLSPEQLTEDDARYIVLKQDGKILQHNGAVHSRRVITQAIGQTGSLDIKIQTTDLEPGEFLVLATDGCYELQPFKRLLVDLQRYSDLKSAAQILIMDLHLKSGSDDGTIAIIRRTDYSDNLSRDYLDAFNNNVSLKDTHLIGHLMLDIIIGQMVKWAKIPDAQNLLKGLGFLKKENLKPNKKAAMQILKVFKNDTHPDVILAHRKITQWIMGF